MTYDELAAMAEEMIAMTDDERNRTLLRQRALALRAERLCVAGDRSAAAAAFDAERAEVRADAALYWLQARAACPMTLRERLSAAWLALVECGDALYGAARGWR